MKALVVESSKSMRAVLRRILSVRGFDVIEAANGKAALEALPAIRNADLVLLDWTAEECGDIEFISRLRQESAHVAAVIMLTAVEPGLRELHWALVAGVNDYLLKPFTSFQIDEKLARAGLGRCWTDE